ncbi:MAG: 8-oxo-dGTP diphosphatase [Clostridiales bacterium]|jgi:8-oxo-dGTP diphosphatase|nr:8-oxo-dGTP diphosphatase [Clostridiales bacterium]
MVKMTTLCYLRQGNEYLMLHRTKKQVDENAGKWIGIGGHFEFGESPEECMKREVSEETGLEVNSWQYRGIVTFVSDNFGCEYMHLFMADGWEGSQKDCDEGVLEWIDKERLSTLNMWQGDRLFLDLLFKDTPFFSLKLVYKGETLTTAFLDGKRLEI